MNNQRLRPARLLIQSKNKTMTTEIHQREEGRGSRWQDYIPLIVIVVLTLLTACAKQIAYGGQWPRVEAGVSTSPAAGPPKEKENTAKTCTAGV
jgi:hypothetical protein